MRLPFKIMLPVLAVALIGVAAGAPQNTGSIKTAASKATTASASAKPTAQKTKPPQFTATPNAKAGVSKAGQAKSTTTKAAPATAQRRTRVAGRTRPLPTWHPAQMAPTTDRYREIQQALMDRGYFHGETSGVWGPESLAALKRFQQDQKLDPDGKLGSLTLISLGLGAKRGTAISALETGNATETGSEIPRQPAGLVLAP